MTIAAVWVRIETAFGNQSMEVILICGVSATLNIIWYTTSKLETRGKATSQELSVKDQKGDK